MRPIAAGPQLFGGVCEAFRVAPYDSYDLEARAQTTRRFKADATAPTGHQGEASGFCLPTHDALLAQLSRVKGADGRAPGPRSLTALQNAPRSPAIFSS